MKSGSIELRELPAMCVLETCLYSRLYNLYTRVWREDYRCSPCFLCAHSLVHTNSFTKIFTCPKIRCIYMVTSHYLLNNSAIAFCLQHRRCIWSLLFPPIFYFRIHWFPSFNCSTCSRNLVLYCCPYNVNVVLSCVANVLKNM